MPDPSRSPIDAYPPLAQAQAGNVRAIERLLSQTFADPHLRVEVSRRGHTLYVFLTVAGDQSLDAYATGVYTVIADLYVPDLDRLEVIEGTDCPQVNRWRQPFYLPSGAGFVSPSPPSTWEGAPQGAGISPQRPWPQRPQIAPAPMAPAEVAPPPAMGHRMTTLVKTLARARTLKGLVALGALGGVAVGLGSLVTPWAAGGLSLLPLSPENTAPEDIYLDNLGDPIDTLSAASVAAETNPAPPQSAPIFAPQAKALSDPPRLTLNAVGDIIPGTDYRTYRLPQNWQYLFGSIQYQLQQADIVFGNFESTLTDVQQSAKDTSQANTFAFRTPPWYASVLKAAGFDVMSVANNHAFDFGEQGFTDTITHLNQEGIKAVGRKGDIVYTEAKGLTIAFLAFSHLSQHNTIHDLETAAALVREADQRADLVVVSFHGGGEGSDAMVTRDQTEYFFSENRGNVVQFSRTVIDHGADLVLGHGPHVPRALELYQNKLIAYSLGNFLGYRTLSTEGPLGTSLILSVNLRDNGDFASGRIVPVALDRNGVPYLDDYFQSVILIRSATRRDFPDTPLTIDEDGYLWRTP